MTTIDDARLATSSHADSVAAAASRVGPVGVPLPLTRRTKSELSWQQVVTAIAAAAGGAAWVSAVGSGVVALRLERAQLPVEPVVALMSAEHRFALGAGLLIVPLLAGFIAFLADWVSWRGVQDVKPGRRNRRAVAAFLLGATVLFLVLRPPWETFLAESLAVAITVPFAFQLCSGRPETRHSFHERVVVFLAVLGATGVGAIVAEAVLRAPSFDEAQITVRDQPEPVAGGYITSTDHSVVLTSSCERIQAVPRDLIVAITVGPDEHTASQC